MKAHSLLLSIHFQDYKDKNQHVFDHPDLYKYPGNFFLHRRWYALQKVEICAAVP